MLLVTKYIIEIVIRSLRNSNGCFAGNCLGITYLEEFDKIHIEWTHEELLKNQEYKRLYESELTENNQIALII